MPDYIDINPAILQWAVQRSKLPIESFKPEVKKWISGEAKPTFRMLELFAKKAMVPFGYLFLNEPPIEDLPVPDYRTRSDESVLQPSPNLLETIFLMQRRQAWMKEYLSEMGNSGLDFVGSVNKQLSPRVLANRIRDKLKIQENWAESQSDYDSALRLLRDKIESIGILIFLNSIVGNNTHRSLDPDEFQGFVLVDKLAPLIFINSADFLGPKIFTVIHELAHIWIGQDALFDFFAGSPSNNSDIEVYCNMVAAEFLVPRETLVSSWTRQKSIDELVSALSRKLKVSKVVIARRAANLSLISQEDFFTYYHLYMEKIKSIKARKGSGGNFWNTQNVRVGKKFGAAVINAAKEGKITYSEAYDLTQLYGKTFDNFTQHISHLNG